MYPTSIFQSAELSIDDKNKLNMVINHLLFLMRIKSVSLYEHSQRVSNLAAATAIYMRLTANEITLIRNAGLLHDIGLICVPNHVLTNYPYVSKRDIQVYKRHPDLGANILESCPGMEDLIPLIRFHHERWDGTGYPKHLKRSIFLWGPELLRWPLTMTMLFFLRPTLNIKTDRKFPVPSSADPESFSIPM